MINFLIGFMILPTLIGIVLVITWAIEYFKYLSLLLKRHYTERYLRKQAIKLQKELSNNIKNVIAEDQVVDNEANKDDNINTNDQV